MSSATMSDYQMILNKLTQISEKLDSFSAPSMKKQKEKKERKPRDPNAPPAKENSWVSFTGRVGKLFDGTDYSRGKEKQQFCSFLKANHENAYEMSDKDILAARATWTPPEPKPKSAKQVETVEEPLGSDGEPQPKPKRTMSDEQKAKMAAGRKAAAEKEKAAENQQPVEETAEEQASTRSPAFRPFPFKGKQYFLDSNTNGLWKKQSDGSKGDWVGILAADRKSIDTEASNPYDADE